MLPHELSEIGFKVAEHECQIGPVFYDFISPSLTPLICLLSALNTSLLRFSWSSVHCPGNLLWK